LKNWSIGFSFGAFTGPRTPGGRDAFFGAATFGGFDTFASLGFGGFTRGGFFAFGAAMIGPLIAAGAPFASGFSGGAFAISRTDPNQQRS
jgi:hypothetical protein